MYEFSVWMVSPASSTLTNDASMPADPVAETAKVNGLAVPNSSRRPADTWFIISRKSGSRCPTVGRAIASRTRLLTLDGPGPIKIRGGGWK